MATKSIEKVSNIYICEICDYNTSYKSNYEKHKTTAKHKKILFGNKWQQMATESIEKVSDFQCKKCNKIYKDRTGLWRHNKKCSVNNQDNIFNENNDEDIKNINPHDFDMLTNLVLEVVKSNNELQKQNNELHKNMMEIYKNGVTNIQNIHSYTNSHNKTFNLNVFLNETCKDAMNITDFVDSIQLQLTDLERIGEIGYIDGISNIIIKNLNKLDVTKRPVHCTDKKREVLYVKDDNKWEKDDEENKKVRKAIKNIANKNMRLIPVFKAEHPDCSKSNSKFSDQYNKIIVESMGLSGDNDNEKEDKIIKKIAKEVVIDKV